VDRPGLQALLADIENERVDCVVVYKVDRLSRSQYDFAKIIDVFEQRGVSFISVTQQFNTTTSMGRLTLNILLSFSQFERELSGERIRNKIAAPKRRGMHCGGMPVLGYDTDSETKRLVVSANEAKLVRSIFERFRQLGSGTGLVGELNEQGHITKRWVTKKGRVAGGVRWNRGHLYRLLNNRKYVGQVTHKDKVYPGEHKAIVPKKLWDDVHRILAENHKARACRARAETPALLKGIIRCGHCGGSMGITFTRSRGKTYRYYKCVAASKNGMDTCPVRSVSAGIVEEAVFGQLRAVFRSPEIVARTYREAKAYEEREVGDESTALTEGDVIDALTNIDPVWNELFPGEQARVVRLLVERVEVREDGLEVRLRASGLHSLVAELSETDAVGEVA
jgi:site-specific DNA recombinase